jgi:hypothetical protein
MQDKNYYVWPVVQTQHIVLRIFQLEYYAIFVHTIHNNYCLALTGVSPDDDHKMVKTGDE